MEGAIKATAQNPGSRGPDIALAVLNGEEPEGFTLRKLRQGIPVLWEDQRKQFGFQAQ